MKFADSILGSLIAACVCTGGCLDLSPVRYVDPRSAQKDAAVNDPGNAGDEDGGTGDAGTQSLIEECRTCLATGPCSTKSEPCDADTKCAAFSTCMTDTVCWGTSLVDINNVAPCIITCGAKAGLTSQIDPAAALLVPVLLCAQDPAACASSCAAGMVK
jgi:hypothetical protein